MFSLIYLLLLFSLQNWIILNSIANTQYKRLSQNLEIWKKNTVFRNDDRTYYTKFI